MKGLLVTLILLVSSVSSGESGYQFFESFEKASNHFQAYSLEINIYGGREIPVPVSNVKYEKVYAKPVKFIKILVDEYNKLYDLDLDGKYPEVLILPTDIPNAFVLSGYPDAPYYIVLDSGILDSSDEALMGVLAHELSHLFFFKTLNDKFENNMPPKFYLKQDNAVFGDDITEEMEEEGFYVYEKMSTYEFYIGPFTGGIFGNMPYTPYQLNREGKPFLPPSGEGVFRKMIVDNIEKQECKDVMSGWGKFRGALMLYTQMQGLGSQEDTLDELADIRASVEADVSACLDGVKYDYKELLMTYLDWTEEDLEKAFVNETVKETFEEIVEVFEEKEAAEALFEVTSTFRERLIIMEENLRVYTLEDQADETAVKIMNSLGFSVSDMSLFLVGAESLSSEEAVESCKVQAEKKEPYYGPLSSMHHSSCWRFWRNTELENRLNNESIMIGATASN